MEIKATTIIAVKRDGKTVIAGDGQATLGNQVFKSHTHKVKKIYHDQVIIACAGNAADGFQMGDEQGAPGPKYFIGACQCAVRLCTGAVDGGCGCE